MAPTHAAFIICAWSLSTDHATRNPPAQLWSIDDPMPIPGLEVNARLVIARLTDGTLWAHAPFAISDEDEAAIRALGEVRHIVVPNNFHYTQVEEFSRRFPAVPVWAPPQLDAKLKSVPHQNLETLPDAWEADFDVAAIHTPLYHEWVFCHRATRTLIVTDLGMNIPRPQTPLARILAAVFGVGRGFKPTRFERSMLSLGSRASLRTSLKTVLSWDFDSLVMAHGAIIEKDGKRHLQRAYAWLKV